MINSMTGYGQAQGQSDGVTYIVEVKTVNNRYFKANIKLPEAVAFLEEDIDKLLRENILRGTVNYVLRLKEISAGELYDINERGLRAIVEKLNRIACSADIKCNIDIGSLLALPGILAPVSPDEKAAERLKQDVLSATQKAVDQLKQMRAAEGKALAADLGSHCKTISENLKQIVARSSVVLQEYQKKLKKRVDELLADAKLKLDEETLAREVAVFADRSDISEEVARLDSHLQQFIESCRGQPKGAPDMGNAAAGRRLEFLSQEMLREINTISSKASDSEITHWVVDIKCRIDRIKEQVQNIE
jgi:uncharacterized protein (TIGR00255 family)